jgi:hypothetical protein
MTLPDSTLLRICHSAAPCFEPTPGAMALMRAVRDATLEECATIVRGAWVAGRIGGDVVSVIEAIRKGT